MTTQPDALVMGSQEWILLGILSLLWGASFFFFKVLAAELPPLTVGLVFGLLGVVTLIGPRALFGAATRDAAGQLACLGAALSYAFAGLFGRRFRGIAPLKVAAGQLTASTLLLLPVTAVIDRPWRLPAPSAHALQAWAALALFSTALAYLIYFRILARAGATNLMLVTFLLPVSALVLGTLFLGESITLQALGGMVLIWMGLAALDGRLWTTLRPA